MQHKIFKKDDNPIRIWAIIVGATLLLACDKTEELFPSDFVASQGTYVGVINISSEFFDDLEIFSRFNESAGQWEDIAWTWSANWSDNGFPQGLIPGKEYRYKKRISRDGNDSDYSKEVKGYTFKALPSKITSIDRENFDDFSENTIHWKNPNDLSQLNNLVASIYEIHRSDPHDPSFFRIHTVTEHFKPNQSHYAFQYKDQSITSNESYSYKIITIYQYKFITSDGNYHEDRYMVSGTSDEAGEGSPDENGEPLMGGGLLPTTIGPN